MKFAATTSGFLSFTPIHGFDQTQYQHLLHVTYWDMMVIFISSAITCTLRHINFYSDVVVHVYSSYFLDYPQVPVYPLDFSSCSSTSEVLLSCIYPYSVYMSPSSEVGISCNPQTIGIYYPTVSKLAIKFFCM